MPIYRKECGINTFLVCIWILKSFTSPSEHPVPDTRAPSSRSLGRGMHGRRWPHGSQETSQVKTPWRKHANAALCWKKSLSRSPNRLNPLHLRWKTHCICWLLCNYKSDTSLATGWQGHPAIGSSSSKQSEGVTFEFPAKMHEWSTDFNPNDLFESCSPRWSMLFFHIHFNFKEIFEANFGFDLVLTTYPINSFGPWSPGNPRRSRLVSPLWSRTWVERCNPAMRILKNGVGTYLLVLIIFAL